MKFGRCLWLIPDELSDWHNYTDGFTPHMTIKTNVTDKELEFYRNNIDLNKSYEVELIDDLIYEKKNNFHCLYFKVKLHGFKPNWWPDNAHISLKYRYNNSITKKEIEKIYNLVKNKKGILNSIKLMSCNTHYNFWKDIETLN